MPIISFEALDHARAIAQAFVEASRLRGWSNEERQQLESTSKAIWDCRNMLLADVDNPSRRRRQEAILQAQLAAALIDFAPSAERAPREPMLTAAQVAQQLGLTEHAVEGRARTRRLGLKAGPGRRAPLLFSDAEVQQIAASRRGAR
jgi:hypothetical protein